MQHLERGFPCFDTDVGNGRSLSADCDETFHGVGAGTTEEVVGIGIDDEFGQ